MSELILKPIGQVLSPFKKRFGTPRQGVITPSAKAFIHIWPEFRDGLVGLDEFSHLWVMSYLDQSEKITKMKIRPPRLRGKKVGLFSTRGPHRPNPLGLSAVKILEVTSKGVWISGVDLLDQTPVVDIKPYIKAYDAMDSLEPEWIGLKPMVEIEFSKEFEDSLLEIESKEISKEELKSLISECLQFDPRPIPYLKRKSETYFLSLYEYEVEVLSEGEKFSVKTIFLRP